jgi:hypothetical protein
MARTAVVAGTASTVAGRVNRRQQQKWAAQDAPAQPQQGYAEPQQGYAQPQAAPPAEDRVQKLKDLAALKEQGVLTDTEFSAEKARILAG